MSRYVLRSRIFWLYALITLVMLVPVVVWPLPRTADLVNHWARLTLLGGAENPFYEVKWGLIPNLGVDALYIVLHPLLSAYQVARLAFILSIVLPAIGAWCVHRTLFPASPQAIVLWVPVLSHNLIVTAGLVNISMGIGLVLLLLAWVLSQKRGVLGVNIAAVGLLFCHIFAFAFFVVTIGLREISPRSGEAWIQVLRRGVFSLRYSLAGLCLIPFLEPIPNGIVFGGAKLIGLLAPFTSHSPVDKPFYVILCCLFLVALLCRYIVLTESMRLTVSVLWLIVLVMPSSFGTGVLLDARLALFTTYLSLAALRMSGGERVTAALALALAVGRVFSLAPEWIHYNRAFVETRHDIATLPEDERVLVVATYKACEDYNLAFYGQFSPLVIIDRHGFANSLYAIPGMQPVRARDPDLRDEPNEVWNADILKPDGIKILYAPMRSTRWAQALQNWRAHFDDVMLVHGSCKTRLHEPDLVPISEGEYVSLYHLRR